MRKLGLLFLVGLASGFISGKLLVSAQASLSTDDLYLEGRPSGDFPVDDEDDQDGGSGSGSGDYYPTDEKRGEGSETKSSREMIPTHATPTRAAESQDHTTPVKSQPYVPDRSSKKEDVKSVPGDMWPDSTRASATKMPPPETTEATLATDNYSDIPDYVGTDVLENEIVEKKVGGINLHNIHSSEQVTTENMWERIDVLAAVIACGVVGFLCAVFLLLLLAYRMKKKDEGSYDLGDTKLSTTAYHKAPTKEFYA